MTKYHIELDDKEMLLLSASMCLASIVARTPAVFDTMQLDTTNPEGTTTKYAEGVLTLMDNEQTWLSLVQKLNAMV